MRLLGLVCCGIRWKVCGEVGRVSIGIAVKTAVVVVASTDREGLVRLIFFLRRPRKERQNYHERAR